MPHRALLAAGLFLLAACATPQEQCIARETRELAVIDRLIAETETNLARGYAVVEYTERRPGFRHCAVPGYRGGKHAVSYRLCNDVETVRRTRERAIDPAAERRKLALLKEKRGGIAKATAARVAQCRAAYPA